MASLNRWQSGCAGLMALSLTGGAIAPLIAPAPSFAQSASFSDVSSSYWASPFISELARREVIAGFPDNTFRPEQPVTRAQFAAMVRKAFQKSAERGAVQFTDVPSNYWAYSAIQEAYRTGFLSGYPGNRFEPNQNIPREQVLVSLTNGLDYSVSGDPANILTQYYNDADAISGYARSPIAAATGQAIVVNYPNVKFLNPTRSATRADVAAFIYQALVKSGQVSAVNSPYVVAQSTTTPTPQPTTPQNVTIPRGTTIPVRYAEAEKILVTKDETAPLTLIVAQRVVDGQGRVLIPVNTQVVGKLQPASGGSQFVADELVLRNGRRINIDASSEVITKTEQVRKGASTGTLVKNAALGAAAAAAIQVLTGDKDVEVLPTVGGAGVGALLTLFLGRQSVDLVAIDPDTDLTLTLDSPLSLNARTPRNQ